MLLYIYLKLKMNRITEHDPILSISQAGIKYMLFLKAIFRITV